MSDRHDDESSAVNERFPLLSLLSYAWRIVGWLMTVGGLYAALKVVYEYHDEFGEQAFEKLLVGLGVLLVGQGLVIVGEMVGVAFAIEANTRRTADLTAKALGVEPEEKAPPSVPPPSPSTSEPDEGQKPSP